MRKLLLYILFAVIIFSAQAQNKNAEGKGLIKGRILDSLSNQPVEYATIRLLKLPGGDLVNGTIADGNGIFAIDHIPEGSYKLVIDFLGYKRAIVPEVIISKDVLDVDIGSIRMASDPTLLNDIVITAQKNIIENKIDKIIYNAEADLSSQNGVATDILKKVPQVSVDINGNVELQGNGSVRFLINGRPSALFGNNTAEVLQSLPASQIQSIEVITIPGAKYDAAGAGGIINIILKKNKDNGTNGSMSLSAGSRLENASLNLSIRKGKFGVNTFFSGNAQMTSTRLSSSNRLSQDSITTTQLLQDGRGDFNRQGFESGLSFDFDPTEKDNFQGMIGYDFFGNNTSGYSGREFITKDDTGVTTADRNDAILTTNNFRERAIDTQLGYKRKLGKEDQELEIGYNSSMGRNNSYYDQRQENLAPESIYNGSYGKNPGIENEHFFYVNYTDPLSKNVLIETGLKTEIDRIISHSNVYQLNTTSDNYAYNDSQSSSLDYKRQIYAGYLSSTIKITKQFTIKSGARYEYTTSTAYFSNSGKINFIPYSIFVPSIVLMKTFSESQAIKLSYTKRIERPDYGDLNPFVNASDPRNVFTGNPKLKPEITNRVELSYNQSIADEGSMVFTLFARNNTNDIQPYTRFYSSYMIGDSTFSNVTVRTRENIGHENNYGVDLFASMPVSDKLNLRASLQLFERYIYTGISAIGDVHGFNYRTNLNATYNVSKSLTCELFGNYRSKMTNAQGTRPQFTTYVFAFRKVFMHKQASIALTATNFIWKYVRQETRTRGDNFTLVDLRQIPYRSFGINFTYKFGGFKKDNEEGSNLPGAVEN